MTLTIHHPQSRRPGVKRMLLIGAAGAAALVAAFTVQAAVDSGNPTGSALAASHTAISPAGQTDLQTFGEMIIATGPPSNSLGPISRPEPTQSVDPADAHYLAMAPSSSVAPDAVVSAERGHFETINDVEAAAPTGPGESVDPADAHYLAMAPSSSVTGV